MHEPDKVNDKIAILIWSVIKAMIPKLKVHIAETPPQIPSILSKKLKLLTKPNIHIKEKKQSK